MRHIPRWAQTSWRSLAIVTLVATGLSSGAVSFATGGSSSSGTQTGTSLTVSYVNPQTGATTTGGLTGSSAVATTTTGPSVIFTPNVMLTISTPSTVASTATYAMTAASTLPASLSSTTAALQMIPDVNGPAATLASALNGQGFQAGTAISLSTGTVATTSILNATPVANAVSLWQVGCTLPTTTTMTSATETGSIALEATLNAS